MRRIRSGYSANDTIAAISTPVGEGGIGIVRLSGKKALSVADKVFISKDKGKPSSYKTHTVHYGHIVGPRRPSAPATQKSEIIDEVILTVMRAPKSYTKEDIVEINCHGGIIALRKVLELALSLGARMAEPGEFTKRAFLNGRIDLAQAEAVLDLIRSKTESSMKVAMAGLKGRLSGEIRSIKNVLINALGEIEAQIDFSGEDIETASKEEIMKKLYKVSKEIRSLADNMWKGMIFKEGIMCVICGKPNVGKSSLMNAFLKRNRVIVTPVPGTTRDAIEEEISLGGIPVRIVDTAGISAAKDTVGKHGIRKSRSYIKRADLILFMLDLSKKWSKTDTKILKGLRSGRFMLIANKSDLKKKLDTEEIKKITKKDEITEISLLKKKNLKELESAILNKIWHGEIPNPESSFAANLRHKKDLECAYRGIKKAINTLQKPKENPEIVASDLNEAVFRLGTILGDSVEPDILGRVFSKFCIGK